MLLIFTVTLLIIQTISTASSIINKESKSKFTNWDKLQIFLLILALGCGLSIFLLNEDKEDLKDRLENQYKTKLEIQLKQRDSIHKNEDSIQTKYFVERLDSSYERSIKASNEALAKYNLTLIDSLNTVTKKINIKSSNSPQLSFVGASKNELGPIYYSKEKNSESIIIKLQANKNTCYNIQLRYLILDYKINNGQIYYQTIDTGHVFYDRNFLPEEVVSTVIIDLKKDVLKMDEILVLITGKFSYDPENIKVKDFNEGFFFNIKGKSMGYYFSGDDLKKVLLSLKRRNIIK